MNISLNRNSMGELVTVDQACELFNLGRTRIRQIAEESGAAVKIGKSYRIKRQVLFDYIDKNFSIS